MSLNDESGDKETELKRQKDAIGEMRSSMHHSHKKKDSKTSVATAVDKIAGDADVEDNGNPESKENSNNKDDINEEESKIDDMIENKNQREELQDDEDLANVDDESIYTTNGSTPEMLEKDNIENGNNDSTNNTGNAKLFKNIKENKNTNDVNAAPSNDEKGGDNKQLEVNENIVDVNEDEIQSIDDESIDTIRSINDTEMPTAAKSTTLSTFEKNQRELMKKAKEETEETQQGTTYTLPTVLGYNYNQKKKTDDDSDSDAELFATDNCNQCQTIKKEPKLKTRVCTLM